MLRLSLVAAVMLCVMSQRAYALSCRDVRYYVNVYGEEFVRRWAKDHGYLDWQIASIRRQCLADRR